MSGVRDYPEDMNSAWEITRFTSKVALNLDFYRLLLEGHDDVKKHFDPVAIKRLGCLLEEEAQRYFETKSNEGVIIGRNSRGVETYFFDQIAPFCRTNQIDEFNLQLYLGGKELQRFEDYPKSKIEEMRNFSLELSKEVNAYDSRFNSFRRGLVA